MTVHRRTVLILTIILSIGLGWGITRMQGEVRLWELFPYGHPYLKVQQKFGEIFGSGGSAAVIAIKAKDGNIFKQSILTKVQKMNNEVSMWDEVYRTLTISIASRTAKVVKAKSKGEISIEPLMWPEVPKNEQEMAILKQYIFSNPAYNGTLVSKDGAATLLITEFRNTVSYQRCFELLRELELRHSDEETSIHIVGFPMLMGWIYSYRPEIMMVSGLSVLIMFLILVLIFRNFNGIMTPTLFSIMCTAMGLGFIGWTGINFSPLLYVLAFLVGARMVSHSVQITHRYFEEYAASNNDKVKACYETMRMMLIPNWSGTAAEAFGFLVLLFAQIILMQMVAIFMTFWMVCIALCGIVTPILCCYLPIGKASAQYAEESKKLSLLDKICLGLAGFSIGKGRVVVAGLCVALFVFTFFEASHLKIGDPSPGTSLLWPDHKYNTDTAIVDGTFSASSEALLLFYAGEENSVYDPAVFTTFEAFDRHMKRQLPDIYKSSDSLINFVKMLNETLRDGDKIWYQMPRNESVLTGLLGYTRDNLERGTLGRFIDGPIKSSQITIFFADHTSDNLLRIKKAYLDFFRDRPMKIDKGQFELAGGRIGMEIALNEEMVSSHATIDAMVLFAIFALCALTYYSILAGLMLTIPLVLANFVAYAYMSLNNIGLSVNTLPIAAVGVGVGVDFPIYIYSRCVDEYARCGDWTESILTTVRTSGKAVIFTGLTMILPILTWTFVSNMKFMAQMGLFLSMIMGANMLLAITLHPLMLYTIKPKFIIRRAAAQVASGKQGH